MADPIYPQGGIAVLRGNLAPGGAIIKQSAADPSLMEHEGRAVVFEGAEDLAAAHRSRRPRRDGRRRAGAEEHRPERRARHARSRLHPDPAQAGARRRQGHRADLRRPHERHRVRHHRAARDARGRDRRPARARAQRRPHPPQRRQARDQRCSSATPNWPSGRATTRSSNPPRHAATASCSCDRCCRPMKGATSISCRPRSAPARFPNAEWPGAAASAESDQAGSSTWIARFAVSSLTWLA